MTDKLASKMRWYDSCVGFQRLDEAAREKVCHSKSSRHGYARIAQLHRIVGEALDKAGAPLRCLLWIAYAPDEAEARLNTWQQTRFDAVMKRFKVRGTWPLPHHLSVMRIAVWERLHGRVAAPAPGTHLEQIQQTLETVDAGERTVNMVLALTVAREVGLERSKVPRLRQKLELVVQELRAEDVVPEGGPG